MTSYMKRIKDKIQLACLAVLAVGMVACSQDELISPNAGGEGAPVTFSATGLPMGNATATRASGDAMWSDGMTVGVMIDGEVKPYSVTPDVIRANKRASWPGHLIPRAKRPSPT